ncbi:Skp1 family, dimerization domain-containing protein [Polychytrium aggregatum]|uniref:Skp1 family, dimerization domain-containing protein n=1 Tax=Polychytrium aggregatum TaxID=110093 RepID=UPI0022FE9FC8|nr:Skp1 family, dimerization domain-containing protein [Polychytrium aggregatum]KAI9203130.1 Skp1 family, dimerization domain-containing protein [Polychytrium aggregatum]
MTAPHGRAPGAHQALFIGQAPNLWLAPALAGRFAIITISSTTIVGDRRRRGQQQLYRLHQLQHHSIHLRTMTGTQINLISQNGDVFSIDVNIIRRSALIKNMIEDVGQDETPIPLANVSSSVLKKVIEFCTHHQNDPLPEPSTAAAPSTGTSEAAAIIGATTSVAGTHSKDRTFYPPGTLNTIDPWDESFLSLPEAELFEILLAANYLEIKDLLDVCCKYVANMVAGKSIREIRDRFNIPHDDDIIP